jgi:hypothetical protein
MEHFKHTIANVPDLNGRAIHAYKFDGPGELADFYKRRGLQALSSGQSWVGGISQDEALSACFNGRPDMVAQSDEFLRHFESVELSTSRHLWRDSVAGPFANVPAYIAGQPLSMRMRMRDTNASAPLCVVMDTTSGATVSAEQIARRGSAVLALVRLLAVSRPVELWTLCALDADGHKTKNAIFSLVRIETAPLDLARAAYCMTHAAFPRMLQGEIARLHGYAGHWPFFDYEKTRKNLRALLAPLLPHAAEFLAIPAVNNGDRLVYEPEAWLRNALSEFGPQIGEAA